MLRTAWASRGPAAMVRLGAGTDDRGAGRVAGGWAAGDALTSAGTSTMLASTVNNRSPSRRAWIEASTRTPSDRRLLRSGIAVSAAGALVSRVRGPTGTELLESLRRARQPVDDLGIAFTPGPGADDISGREDRRPDQLHESSLAPSKRRRSEEMPALPAVRPATPPAIRPALRALSLGSASLSALPEPTPLAATSPVMLSSESLTVSRTRSSRFLRLKSLISSPSVIAFVTPSRSP